MSGINCCRSFSWPTRRTVWALCLFIVVSATSVGTTAGVTTPRLPDPPHTQGTAAWNQVELVIVTTNELLPGFTPLADWRTAHGTSATVVTVDWIQDVTPAGVDLQETIRNFLILAHDQWQAEYVLLGGDWGLLPSRVVRSYMRPYPETEYLDFFSDLYFGCLDGNWDADGDGIYGEYSTDGDDPDLVPELGVGRAPVRTLAEATVFVAKVLAHEQPADGSYLDRALFLGEVINPWDWQPGEVAYLDGGQFLDDRLSTLDGVQPPVQAARLYENHTAFAGAIPLTRQSTIDFIASGDFNLVYHYGFGHYEALSLGGYPVADALRVEDVPLLVNAPNYYTIMAMVGETVGHETPTLFEEMIRSTAGGAVAAFGKTEVTYVISSQATGEALFQYLHADGYPRLGQALRQALADFASQAATNQVYHLDVMGTVLLGDPTMFFRRLPVSSVPETGRWGSGKVAVGSCYPNPFNPSTTISYYLPEAVSVKLEIFDVRGRLVDELVTRTMPAGEHSVQWQGTDLHGAGVPSGIYFYRLAAGSYAKTNRMVLLK